MILLNKRKAKGANPLSMKKRIKKHTEKHTESEKKTEKKIRSKTQKL